MKIIQSINNACCFEMVLGTYFDKSYWENQTGAWPLKAAQKVVNYKPKTSSAFSLYI